MLGRLAASITASLLISSTSLAQPSARFPDPPSEQQDDAGATRTPEVAQPHWAPVPAAPPPPPVVYWPAPRRDSRPWSGPETTETRWYGWQILIADGAWISATAATGSSEVFLFGLIGYAAVPPAIHVAHGRVGAALGSAGLRIAGPTLGAMIGSPSDSQGGEEHRINDGAVVGAMLGALVAITIDVAFLAHESRPLLRPYVAPTRCERRTISRSPVLGFARCPSPLTEAIR